MVKSILKLLRVKHWLKNGLIFIPLIFSVTFSTGDLKTAIIGFFLFSLSASIVYIINDIHDAKEDKRHTVKKHRPIASGKISPRTAWFIVATLALAVSLISAAYPPMQGWPLVILGIYITLNIAYSLRLKHIPIIDIFVLATGFVLRIVFGAVIFNTHLSDWLILTVLCGSLYMGIGKRRNELSQSKKTRKVNKFYSFNFLNNSLYSFMALTVSFYSLWSISETSQIPYVIYTVPLVMLILMSYNLRLESKDCDGDPVNVLLSDKGLIILTVLYLVAVAALIAVKSVL